ncbi:MAG: hypothetical protein FP811_14375 [Desulfobacteraceae bacterium]|nr:hypothetical protein [Desulfobacteraceae bacterium]
MILPFFAGKLRGDDMKDKPHIIILGTSHQIQCGTIKHSHEQIQNFRSLIKRICQDENVKCIVEEMSNEGLSNHKVQKTIPFEIAIELSIKHCYTDLTTEQLACLNLSQGHVVQYSLSQPTNELKTHMRELLTNKLVHPIRERYWLANILRINTWPTLLICGSEHGQNMQDLVNSVGYGPVFSWCKYCPREV